MAYAQRFREDTGISFPLLVDERREAYRAAELASAPLHHLLRGDNFRWRKRARAEGHRQHWLGKNPFQLGATFVFAPPDRVLYQHLSQTFGDNPAPAEILKAIA